MKSKRAREAAEVDETPIDEVAEAPAKKRKRGGDDDGVKKGKKKDKELKQEEADIDGAEEKPKKKKKEDKYKREKESRRERKDRKKDLLNLPGDEGEDEEMKEEVEAVNGSEEKKQTKKEKSEAVTGEKKEKKEKKAKKDKKKPKVDDTTPATATTNGEANGIKSEEQPDTNGTDAIDLDASTAEKQDRHIVFVGNLPYTATAASISAHFVSLAPIAVRCLKNKGDDKPCRGIAFVEFGRASHMRTCLDKFHHSEFNDGVSAARKINVELT